MPVVIDTVHINCDLGSEITHMEKHYLKKKKKLISLYVHKQGDAVFIILTLLCAFLLSNVLLNPPYWRISSNPSSELRH